jgi:nucleoid DNA-binding protein
MAKKVMRSSTQKIAAKKAAPVTKTAERVEKIRSAIRPKNTRTLSYTFSEFLENVKGFTGATKKSEVKVLIEDMALLVKDSLKRGYKIPFLGLGKLFVRKSKARQGRNPQTGEIVNIPARKRVRFSAAKALKQAVLK